MHVGFKGYTVYQLKTILRDYLKDKPELKKQLSKPISKLKKYDVGNIIINLKIPIPDAETLPKRVLAYNPLRKYDGATPYTEEEQNKYIDEDEIHYEPLTAKKEYWNKKEKKYELVSLQAHQRKFIEKFIFSNLRGAVVFHGVGTGKTLTAVVSAYYYLKMYPNNKVLVITPSALLYNFIEGMIQYGLDIRDNRYKFYTYEKYIRKRETGENSLVIIDEAHNLRTLIEKSTDIIDDREILIIKKNKRGAYIKMFASDKCHKILCLTATPFVNKPYDVENLLAMVDNREPIKEGDFAQMIGREENRNDFFKYRISHYEKSQTSVFFPERREQIIPIYMDEKYLKEYEQIQFTDDDKLRAFYNGQRNISNSYLDENNPKIDYIIRKILNDKTSKNVVYTAFQDAGILLLQKRLIDSGIKYTMITGKETPSQKEEAKKWYNGYNFNGKYDISKANESGGNSDIDKYINNEYRVMLITKAGAEGVDLVATTNIFLLDTQWNEALTEQIVARAIRFKSHFGLPEDKRYVNVYKLLLVKPSDKETVDKILNNQFPDYNFILGGYKEGKKKESDGLTPLQRAKKHIDFDNEKYKKMNAQEKKEYTNSLTFGYYQTSTNIDKVLSNKKSPSIDLYMFVMSKAKQKTIEEIIHELDTSIKDFESYMSKTETDIRNAIVSLQEKLQRQLTDKEKSTINKKFLEEQKVNVIQRIEEIENSNSFNEMVDKIQKVKDKRKKQEKIKKFQQYFTPKKYVKEILDLCSLKSELKKVSILEPTAGWGNIVKQILQMNKDVHIDIVEIDNENREVLQDLVNVAPDILYLNETKDFLEFLPSEKYDYIIMNPPFHLRKGLKYKKDYYDIDFVKRAFGMLKVGGELIAITSQKWINNKEYSDWLNSHNFYHIEKKLVWKGEGQDELKGSQEKLSDISNLPVSYLKLIKEDNDEDADLLQIDDFTDTLDIKAKQIMENVISINAPIF